MTKKRRLFLLFSFIFLCLWFGFQAGTLAKGDETTRMSAYLGDKPVQFSKALAPEQGLPGEIRLLVVGVDRLAVDADIRLRSVWFVVSNPSQEKLVWYGYYPAIGPGSEEANRNLESHFYLEAGQKMSTEFQAFLQTYHNLIWNSALLLDDQQVAQLIDTFDGIKLQGQAVNSRQVLAGLEAASKDSRMARMFQSEVIRGFCERRDELGSTAAGAGVDLIAGRLATPPPGMWNETMEEPSQALQRIERLLKSNQFLPCEISEF